MATSILGTAREVWDFLCNQAGLEPLGRDKEVVEELRGMLALGPGAVDFELERLGIPTEAFVEAFLAAITPFAKMMVDILRMFEEAGANTSNDNVNIEFRFDEVGSSLEIDLNAFRSAVKLWSSALTAGKVRVWDIPSIWSLNEIVTDRGMAGSTGDEPVDLRRWLDEFDPRETLPPMWLPAPRCGDAVIQEIVDETWKVWTSFLQACHNYAGNHSELIKILKDETKEEQEEPSEATWPRRFVAQVEHDFWTVSFAKGMYHTFQGPLDEGDRKAKAEALQGVLASRPIRSGVVRSMLEVLLDVLSLPYWRFRYEMYSVWVGSLMLKALKSGNPKVHVSEGKLLFSFLGTHLATIRDSEPELHLWAEHRWPHPHPVGHGRTNGIQPDYSLIAAPLTAKNPVVLAVECKQYKRSSTQNFAEALSDYATGLPNAFIVLVNYGPISGNVKASVSPSDARDRCATVEEMRPGMESNINRFKSLVRDSMKTRYLSDRAATVILTWSRPDVDLDLHVTIESDKAEVSHVFYGDRGSLTGPPYAALDHDIRKAPGRETCEMVVHPNAMYTVEVEWYGDDADWPATDASLELQIDGQIRVFHPTDRDHERTWKVLKMDGSTGSIIANRV